VTVFSSLTNRIFFASALLAVVSIGVAIYNVNVAVTSQAEQELRRRLNEAATLVEEYRGLSSDHFSREARLLADIPRLKAVVALNDPPTVQPFAAEFQGQLDAALVLITNRAGRVLAVSPDSGGSLATLETLGGIREAAQGREAGSLYPHAGGILQIVTVPIWINPHQPEILGTLSVGFGLDNAAARNFRALTNSEIAFGVDGAIHAATLPEPLWPSLAALLKAEGTTASVPLDGEDYIALTRPAGGTTAVILVSRTERLRVLSAVHRTLGITALIAVLVATLLSYAVARTVTRPLGAIIATMREMAATGDLTRRIPPASGRWEDEDARVLATTFNRMTDSIERFQREAAQRERLSSLGRLSTVVAHEIRNPLMIIKASLRTLRKSDLTADAVATAVADIDEEVARLNRLVSDVLDFARPIKFERASADVNALCEAAARAASGEAPAPPIRLRLDGRVGTAVIDAERLRLALVNILTNARHAVAAAGYDGARFPDDAITLATSREGRRVRIEVRDRGAGIAAADLPHIFDPFFTTRRTGTGLGLAITRNIIEGLGGTITVSSRPSHGTDVRIELPTGT
jgi:signal transduction histidine kinase